MWPYSAFRTITSVGLLVAVTMLCGCWERDYATSSAVEKLDKQITETQTSLAKVSKSIDDTNHHIIDVQETRIKKLEKDKDEAAGFICGAQLVNQSATTANPGVESELSQALHWTGQASPQVQNQAKERADLLLKNTQASLARLQVLYEEKQKEAAALTEKDQANQKHIITLTEDRVKSEKIQAGLETTLTTVTTKRDEAVKVAKVAKEINDARSKMHNDLKRLLMIFLAIAAIGCGVLGAVAFRFYPSVSLPLGIAGAAFLTAASIIMYIEAWMVGGVLIIGVISVVIAAWIRYYRTRQIADNSIGAIQQLRNAADDGDTAAKAAYERLKPELIDWFGEKGHSLHTEIKDRLRALNVIGNLRK